MRTSRRSFPPLAFLASAILVVALAAGSSYLAASPEGADSGAKASSASAEKPKRSFWDMLRFRKKADDDTAPPAEAPAGKAASETSPAPPPAPKAVEEPVATASPKTLARTQAQLRAGVVGNDPVVRVLLDKVDRGEATSADLNALATVLAKKGLTADALSIQTEAVRIDRKNATLHLNLGTLHRDMGHRSAAMSEYRRALAIDPNFALAHYNVGTLLDASGDYDGAIAEYRAALTIDPTLADPVKNPQVVNNERLMVVNLLLYRQKAGALGLPLIPVKGAAREGGR